MTLSDELLPKNFLEIPKRVRGVLYEQNKSNETIQGHESDTAV